jgi:hypothetical protein
MRDQWVPVTVPVTRRNSLFNSGLLERFEPRSFAVSLRTSRRVTARL